MVQRVINKLEGLLSDIRDKRPTDTEPDRRPKVMPVRYIANHLGCSVWAVKRWLAQHEALRDEQELSELFVDVYKQIADELSESLEGKSLAIAHNPEHPQAFNAQKWLLPKMSPDIFGDVTVDISRADDSDIVETEVMEALTPEEREVLAEHDRRIEEANREVDKILAEARRRAQQREDQQ